MKKTRGAESVLRSLIRESLLEGTSLNLVPHSEVVAAIDNAMRPERLDIRIPGFRDLMIEISIVESGLADGGNLFHRNEHEGSIQGVFQLSTTALEQLRDATAVPKTRDRFDKSPASQKDWVQQTDSEIFGNLKLQAVAACMYVLWLYHNLAGEPTLSSLSSRSSFWKTYYNTGSDTAGTVSLYQQRVKDLGALA